MLVVVTCVATFAVMFSVGVAPGVIEPIVHTPVPELYAAGWLLLTNVNPGGSKSATVTLVAVSGPAFCTVMVKVMSSPTLGDALFTVFDNERSA